MVFLLLSTQLRKIECLKGDLLLCKDSFQNRLNSGWLGINSSYCLKQNISVKMHTRDKQARVCKGGACRV